MAVLAILRGTRLVGGLRVSTYPRFASSVAARCCARFRARAVIERVTFFSIAGTNFFPRRQLTVNCGVPAISVLAPVSADASLLLRDERRRQTMVW